METGESALCEASRELMPVTIPVQPGPGCSWRQLPHDFPSWGTVHYRYRRFRINGTWQKIWKVFLDGLRDAGRDNNRVFRQSLVNAYLEARQEGRITCLGQARNRADKASRII